MKTAWRLLAANLVLAVASGCYQQSLRLGVHEDGAGTIQITERIDPSGARLVLGQGGDLGRRLRLLLVDELASWDGVCAWRDAAAKVDKDSIDLVAKGYFEDVPRLGRDGVDGLAHRFQLSRDAATLTLSWTFARQGGPAPDTLQRCRAIVESLKPLRIEATVTLPNALLAEDGRSGPGGDTATWLLFSGAQLDEDLRALESRLEAGSIAEQEVIDAIAAKLTRTLTVRCRSGESKRAREAFRVELEDARKAYEGSDLAHEIESARTARGKGAGELH